MNGFSYSIDIKRFQNLLDASNDETERRTLLLKEEKAKAALQTPESNKDRADSVTGR